MDAKRCPRSDIQFGIYCRGADAFGHVDVQERRDKIHRSAADSAGGLLYGRRGVFIKQEQDRQEADLKKFYLPEGHDDFGLDMPENYGTLIYYDEDGVYHEEKVPSERGDYGRYYDALYATIMQGAPRLVTEEQTMEQMRILETAGQELMNQN